MRKKIGTQIGWFLTAKQLKQPKDLIEPIQHTINLQPVARHRISRRDEVSIYCPNCTRNASRRSDVLSKN
ncbi:hypothetical protein L5515_003187 [Caenorhabditis briggsae]|uniref:Uncharacterized protein n=1 Tax=Caenorhabditis briggsae TaxID=6238 RepID=A0AAE9JB65_CAEBR|nr:hypothetical protein L5515_003187 [Caenorhabditis briggsae]